MRSVEAERAIGEEQAPGFIAARGGLFRNAELNRYLNKITDKIAATTVVPEGLKPLRVQILDTSDPGAFAVPGGQIFVSRGMIAFANDEAQLAGVIAHELAHVVERHSAKALAANERLIVNIILEEGEVLRGKSPERAAAIIEREIEERSDTLTTFSREQELEADRLGIQMAAAAGYDPSGFGNLLERLEAYELRRIKRTGIDNDILQEIGNQSSYPKLTDRVAALGTFAKFPVDAAVQDRLMTRIDGIRFDDRYQGGIVRNGVYWHPTDRISFDVPSEVLPVHAEDFRMVSPHGLIAVSTDRAVDVTLEELFQVMKAIRGETTDVERTTISGFPAIVSKVKVDGERQERLSEAVFLDLDGGIVSFLLVTDLDKEAQIRPIFSRILNSMKKTDFGDAPQSRRYVTRRVKAGDTVASLLAESQFEEGGETDLRLLNNLGATEEPVVGSWIKLIK